MSVRQSTLHVPRPLEDFVLAYNPDADQYLFSAAMPKKPVKHKADMIRRESRGALLQNHQLQIGSNGQFPTLSLTMDSSLTYLTQPYGVEVPLFDDERANADSEIVYDQRQVKFGLQAICTRFEYLSIGTVLRRAANYGANTATLGTARQWTNYFSLKSDPYADFLQACGEIENQTTKRPNFIGMHARVWDVITNHPKVKARAERELGGGAYMTVELWERILRLKPGTIRLTAAMYNQSTDPNVETMRSFIGPDVIFAMNEPATINSYGFGQTFWFTGEQPGSGQQNYSYEGEDLTPAGDIVVRSYPEPRLGKGATMVKIYGEWDMKILNNKAGYLFKDVVDPNNPLFGDFLKS